MKIRNGFVSNSSSSSFVIIGERITPDQVRPLDIGSLVVIGEELNDGYDYIRVETKDELEFCRNNAYLSGRAWFRVIRTHDLGEEDISEESIKERLAPGEKAYKIEKDHHSRYDISLLHEGYDDKNNDGLGFYEL